MDAGLKQGKSTGYTPPIKTAKGNALAPVESTDTKKESPVLKNAHTQDESLISIEEVSVSKLLAIQILMGDFRAVKAEMPSSWVASSNGKIYWCAGLKGHKLSTLEGKLLVDGISADEFIAKLLLVQS